MQKRNEEQIELIFAIIENATQAVLATNRNGEILYANNKAQELQALEDFHQVLTLLKDTFQGREVRNFEITLTSVKHSTLYFSANTRVLYNSNNEELGAVIGLQDITDSKQTEEKFHIRFKAIFEQSPFSIQIFSKEGRCILVNSAYKKLWNVSDEVVENYVYKTYNILDDQLVAASGHLSYIERGFAGETAVVPDFYYDPSRLGVSGRPRRAGGLVYPLKDKRGNVQEVVIIHHDVTDQYEANLEKENLLKQLTTEKNRLATIINHIPAGVMVIEAPDGKIVLRNERMIEMTKRSPMVKEMKDYAVHKMYKSDGTLYRPDEYPAMRSLKYGEVVNDEELTIIYSDGMKEIFCVNSAPIFDSDGKISASAVVTSNITEKKRLDEIQHFLDHLKSVLLSSLEGQQTIEEIVKSCIPFLADGCFVDLLDGKMAKRIFIHHVDPEIKKKMEHIVSLYPPKMDSPHTTMKTIESGIPHFVKHVDDSVIKSICFNEEHEKLLKDINVNSLITLPLNPRGETMGAICFFTTSPRELDEIDFQTCIEVGKNAALAMSLGKERFSF